MNEDKSVKAIVDKLLRSRKIFKLETKNAIQNLLAAELFTNIHSFITIVTNHAGSDLYSFDDSVKPRSGSFYVRQIISSVNYNYGNNTFFPILTMLLHIIY